MAQRVRPTEQLRALEARQAELRQELTELSASRRALLLRNALLSCWCDTLSHIQLMGGIQEPEGVAFGADGGRFDQLLTKEIKLLQQLSSKAGSLSSQESLEQLLQPDSRTIAACTNPHTYIKSFACQAPTEETLSMDAQALAAMYRSTAHTASIWLHQRNTTAPCEHADSAKQMTATWMKCMSCVFNLILAGKVDVVETAITTNMETMQNEPAAAAKHQEAQAAKLVPLLQLTEQQQELIPIGVKLYYDLLAAVHQERQEINSQMTAVLEAGSDDSAAADSSDTGSTTSRTQEQHLADRRARLQQQEALTNRLTLLLQKEYKLRMAAMGWFVGTLTCEQLSRLAVGCWPYGMRLLFFATEIMQQCGSRCSSSS